MRRLLIGAGVAVVVIAAGGYGAWRLGAAEAAERLDAAVAELARDGVDVTWEERTVDGFPFSYVVELREVVAAAEDGEWRLTTPWTRSELPLLGPREIVTTAAPEGELEIAAPGGANGRLAFDVETEALLVTTPLDGAASTVATADALRLIGRGGGARGAARLAADDLMILLEPGISGERAARITIGALTSTVDDPSGGTATLTGVAIDASGTAWTVSELAASAGQGGRLDLALTAERARTRSADGVEGGAGTFSFRITAAQGRMRYSFDARELSSAVGGGAAAVEADRAMASLDLPLVGIGDTEQARYALAGSLEGIAPSSGLWASLDPQGRLPREPITVVAEVAGRAAAGAGGAAGAPPVRVETVEIERFRAEGMGATAEAEGALDINPGGRPPDGVVTLRVTGWRPVVESLAAAGVIDPAQAALAFALAERLGRADAPPGVFVAEIELSRGMVFANGERVR